MGVSHNWKGSHGKAVAAFFKGAENMVGKIIFGVAVILTFGLYCCVRVGGQADRQMEEMRKKKRKDQESRKRIRENTQRTNLWCVRTAIFGADEKIAAPENSAIIFSQNSQRKIRKKQDNVWVALMENILLVLDTVCRKFYRT